MVSISKQNFQELDSDSVGQIKADSGKILKAANRSPPHVWDKVEKSGFSYVLDHSDSRNFFFTLRLKKT